MAEATAQTAELTGTRALVVDADAAARKAVAELLAGIGMAVTAAASVEEAWSAFRRARPDILVAAGADADELVRRVRALGPAEGALTPAIVLGAVGSAEASLQAGFHVHLEQPVEPALLVACVRDFLCATGLGRAAWSVQPRTVDVVLRFKGHVTATDMRNAVSVLARVLVRAPGPRRVTVDLRDVSGFDPSVGFAAETTVWAARQRITSALVVGGSPAAQLVARGACAVLGVACELTDALPDG